MDVAVVTAASGIGKAWRLSPTKERRWLADVEAEALESTQPNCWYPCVSCPNRRHGYKPVVSYAATLEEFGESTFCNNAGVVEEDCQPN